MEERRNFVRLNKMIKVMYKVIIDQFASTTAPPNTSTTETISGNGMVLLSPKKINEGTKLEMTIELPDGNSKGVEMAGEVIGTNELGANEFEIKIRFIEIDENERDRLVKYIMREDVKKKG